MGGVLNLQALFGGKAWYKSMVGWGVVIFVAGDAAIDQMASLGLVSEGLAATLQAVVAKVDFVLVALGLRRRLPAG